MNRNSTETLNEAIQDLFNSAFDIDLVEQEDCPISKEQLYQDFQESLPIIIERQQENFAKGRALFLQRDINRTASSVFKKVDRYMKKPRPFADNELCSNTQFEILFNQAVDVDEARQYEDAIAMYSVLQLIRPDQVQPFINANIIVWQVEGGRACCAKLCLKYPHSQSPNLFLLCS